MTENYLMLQLSVGKVLPDWILSPTEKWAEEIQNNKRKRKKQATIMTRLIKCPCQTTMTGR